jgi:hypothetical protein
VHRSIDHDVLAATQRPPVWWSVINSNNVVDLDASAPTLAVKMEGIDERSDFNFVSSFEGDDGGNVDSLDLSAFHCLHHIKFCLFTLNLSNFLQILMRITEF